MKGSTEKEEKEENFNLMIKDQEGTEEMKEEMKEETEDMKEEELEVTKEKTGADMPKEEVGIVPSTARDMILDLRLLNGERVQDSPTGLKRVFPA